MVRDSNIYMVLNCFRYLLKDIKVRPFAIKAKKIDEKKTVHIVASGPSANETLAKVKIGEECYMMNGTVLLEEVTVYQPTTFFLIDPAFFLNREIERCALIWQKLNEKINWQMKLVVPSKYVNIAQESLTNVNISLIGVRTYSMMTDFQRLDFFFYKHNLAIPPAGTVALYALYWAIQSGAKTICLHGVDYDFLREVEVDSENRIWISAAHSDDHSNAVERGSYEKGFLWRFYANNAHILKTFKRLDAYARNRGVEIWNENPNSMVDAFRKA